MKKNVLMNSVGMALVMAAAAACNDIESEDVLTSGVSPDYTLEVVDGKTQVSAQLHAGKGSLTFLELTGDDKIIAKHGDEEKELAKQTDIDFNAPSYAANFDTAEAGAEFIISFNRSVDDGAPESKVLLPTAAAIEAPAADLEVSRADDDLLVEVDSVGEEGETTTASLTGDCIDNAQQTLGDGATSVTFAKGTISARKDDDGNIVDDDCELTLTVSRDRAGTLDAAFTEGGNFVARQSRSIKIVSKP